jgi:hypothetical protein
MKFKDVLARVSANCLRGQPVPADLRALWKAQLKEDAEPLDNAEMVLVDELGPDFYSGYDEASGAPADSVRAYRRMFEQIAFVATTMDGGKLGYWLGESNRPVAEAPVVELDSEGQFELRGTSVAEYLLQWVDDPDDFDEVRDWMEEHGIEVTVESQQEIWDKLAAFEQPNPQSWRYQEEEKAREG